MIMKEMKEATCKQMTFQCTRIDGVGIMICIFGLLYLPKSIHCASIRLHFDLRTTAPEARILVNVVRTIKNGIRIPETFWSVAQEKPTRGVTLATMSKGKEGMIVVAGGVQNDVFVRVHSRKPAPSRKLAEARVPSMVQKTIGRPRKIRFVLTR